MLTIPHNDFLSFTRHNYTNNIELAPCTYQLTEQTQLEYIGHGIIQFTPQQYSKSIVLSCGVHGNETAPIEICNDILRDILSHKLQLKQRVLFVFGNLPAMDIAQRFVEENLNRLFNNEHQSTTQEGVRSQQLMQAVKNFFLSGADSAERLHYDLHTAIRESKNEKFAVYPYLHGGKHNKQQLAFLSSCDVNTILLSQSPTSTFSYYTSRHFSAHAFTVELGKVKAFGENDRNSFIAAETQLRKLLEQEQLSLPDYQHCQVEVFDVSQVINKQQADFTLHFSDDMPNFTAFNKGDLIASESGKEYVALHQGEAIVFPNAKVEIGQRALLTVVPCQLD